MCSQNKFTENQSVISIQDKLTKSEVVEQYEKTGVWSGYKLSDEEIAKFWDELNEAKNGW